LSDQAKQNPLLELTSDIVSAYVTNNPVQLSDLPTLIADVSATLVGLGHKRVEKPEPLKPTIPIKKTVTPDHIISLEDGKPYKMLRAHLTRLGMTPQQYRAKWGLPADYPMIAPNYAAARSEMAKKMQLGRKGRRTWSTSKTRKMT
jgi:predicted transcriptional regulator